MIKIAISSDHHGVEMKNKITKYLTKKSYEVLDLGPSTNDAVDYPIYAKMVANAVKNKEANMGIVICKTGIGVSIACNRIKGIRCARVTDKRDAVHTREDNDANVLALDSETRMYKIYDILDAFLKTPFSNLERHKRRIEELDD